MKEQGDFILLVTHLIPYPPRRGVEQRIYKLLRWLKSEGFRVILVVSASSIEQNVLVELRKVAYAVHWTRPPLRTRLGDRLPFLRKILWEPLKLILTLGRRNVSSVSTRPRLASPVGNDELKKALCPDHLVHLVRQLSRKYSLRAVIAEYIFLTPCFAAVPHGVLKIVDTIDMFSLKTTQVLGFGIDDPYACTRDEERESLMRADTVLAIQPREASLLRELVPEREVLLVGMDYQVVDGGGCDEDRSVDLLVVASDNALNVHGLRGFLAECWPRI
nr:hypothetical protein [Acidobacteriota bacterium]